MNNGKHRDKQLVPGCCFVHLDPARTVKHWEWCTWHRKASAKTQVSLRKFLQSEVKIIHIRPIVQNNTYYSARSRWTKQQQYLEKFKTWCWERKWAEKVSNEEVPGRVEEKRTLLNNILCRNANWIGHILRRNCLLHDAFDSWRKRKE